MISSNIGYTGRVTVKIKNKPPIRRLNNGTASLFKVLSDCLAAVDVKSIEKFRLKLPTYIDVLLPSRYTNYELGEADILKNPSCYNTIISNDWPYTLHDYSILYAPMLISSSKSSVNTSDTRSTGSVTFETMINATNISPVLDEANASECFICLVDGAQENVLAVVKMSTDSFGVVSADAFGQATITWTLTLGNTEPKEIR